ncbi:MAG TPA: energy-coupling factor ABC transporter permease, partial [Anaerolineaceae bacterium]|nr:energy-coupling factor ABC transporter permease [Anaerolineaceae bacterium]
MLFSPINPMHIPDGFLSVLLSIVLWVISVVLIGIALRKTGQTIGERQVPLMGVLAAAIFAGQMLNFSVTGGTSGHLLGAAIAAILLGPWPAVLVMTSVVAVQALLFQDGGILALGANLFNMAIIGPFVAYALFTLLMKLFKKQTWGLFVAGFVAAWSSIFIASLACALQLALSGTSPANIAVPAMGAIHALIGIGEGLITIGALAFIFAARKDLLIADANKPARNIGVVVGGLLLSLVLVVLSPLASSHPDGLEWVAEKHGFIEVAREAFYNIVPDYSMPGISNPALATIAAGILGAVIVFGVAYGIARAEKRPS